MSALEAERRAARDVKFAGKFIPDLSPEVRTILAESSETFYSLIEKYDALLAEQGRVSIDKRTAEYRVVGDYFVYTDLDRLLGHFPNSRHAVEVRYKTDWEPLEDA